MLRRLIRLIPLFLVVFLTIFAWEKLKDFKNPFSSGEVEVSHNVLLQQISSMGKLELVKYNQEGFTA
jgi:peptidoglycan/LPS O-acetylase OafA/YrhL